MKFSKITDPVDRLAIVQKVAEVYEQRLSNDIETKKGLIEQKEELASKIAALTEEYKNSEYYASGLNSLKAASNMNLYCDKLKSDPELERMYSTFALAYEQNPRMTKAYEETVVTPNLKNALGDRYDEVKEIYFGIVSFKEAVDYYDQKCLSTFDAELFAELDGLKKDLRGINVEIASVNYTIEQDKINLETIKGVEKDEIADIVGDEHQPVSKLLENVYLITSLKVDGFDEVDNDNDNDEIDKETVEKVPADFVDNDYDYVLDVERGE